MKRLLKTFLILALLIVLGTYIWLRSSAFTHAIPVIADCPKLNAKGIKMPTTVTIAKLGTVTLEVDVSWVATNIPVIMKLGLPPEGGSGGERYSHSNFTFKVDDAGRALAGVHVKLDNYAYFDSVDFSKPLKPRRGQVDVHKGTIETDVTATITPTFDQGSPDVSTSVSIVKTREAGFAKLWNDALPRIWFSFDRKLHEAQKKANKQTGDALLLFRDSEVTEDFMADIVAQKLIIPQSAKFVQRGEKVFLIAEYRLAVGLLGYYKVRKAYEAAKSKHAAKTSG